METRAGLLVHQSVPLRMECCSKANQRKKGLLTTLFATSLASRGLCVVSSRGVIRPSDDALFNGAAVLLQAIEPSETSESLSAACAELSLEDGGSDESSLPLNERSVSTLVWFDEKVAANTMIVDTETYRLLGADLINAGTQASLRVSMVYLDGAVMPRGPSHSHFTSVPVAVTVRFCFDHETKRLLAELQGPAIDAEIALHQQIRWHAAERLLTVGTFLVGVPWMGLLLNLQITGAIFSERHLSWSSSAVGKGTRQRPGNCCLFRIGRTTRILVQGGPGYPGSAADMGRPVNEYQASKQSITTAPVSSSRRAQGNALPWDGFIGQVPAKTTLIELAREFFDAEAMNAPHILSGVILSGPSGCGKSFLGRALASKLQVHLEYLPCAWMMGSGARTLQQTLDEAIANAFIEAPSVLLLDDLDVLLTDRAVVETRENLERFRAILVAFFRNLNRQLVSTRAAGHVRRAAVLVIATARQREPIDRILGNCEVFGLEVALSMPSRAERLELLEHLVTDAEKASREILASVAEQTRGFTPADLTALWRRASLAAHARQRAQSVANEAIAEYTSSEPPLSAADWREALATVRPSSLPDWTLERPRTRWSDIGGQERAKQILRETLTLVQQHVPRLESFGFRMPRGILLYGPPGCSKTLLARAAAAESGLPMLMVRGPELFNKYVGESEKAVQRVFQRARAAAPSLLFFDEIDALATNRTRAFSDGATGAEERVLAQLLTELDGVEPLRDVIVIAATNRPDLLDEALLRPGRFDRLVYVGLPDMDERRHILRIHLGKVPLAVPSSSDPVVGELPVERRTDGIQDFLPTVSAFRETLYERLAVATEGYSGAEIAACIREACLLAMEQDPATAEQVYPRHLEEALQRVQPRTDTKLLRLYEEFETSFRVRRKPLH
jgi:SpoVK/Ycf46/Vps4 family AAA+-type ATPase